MAASTLQAELQQTLSDEGALHQWLASRGFHHDSRVLSPPRKKDLSGVLHFTAADPLLRAPRLLVLWRKDMTERSVHGSTLRMLQREANNYRTTLLGNAATVAEAPDLFLLACPEFLLLFPLNGDPFARRMRFAPARLPQGSELAQRFQDFSAVHLATFARSGAPASAGGDGWDELLALVDQHDNAWDLGNFFVGSQLDENFVRFMGSERQRIARLLLRSDHRNDLLKPVWACFEPGSKRMPPIETLIQDRKLRASLIATVDTVLLRIVLYRYLEVQFGHDTPSQEERRIALGSTYDELLRRSFSDTKRFHALLRRVQPFHQAGPELPFEQQQGSLFGEAAPPSKGRKGKKPAAAPPPATKGEAGSRKPTSVPPPAVDDPEAFARELSLRAERYQAIAGGDLHQGNIAEAANQLESFLRARHNEEFALLLAGTRNDDYNFHYADLDPRAFQDFYQHTIGTDIRLRYDKGSGEVVVEVAEHERNRKEQGAYYTDEETCRWLVKRTLDRRLDDWTRRFHEATSKRPAPDRKLVRKLLAELMGWKILDPTCGGGIFLRAAFEALSRRGEVIAERMALLSDEARNEICAVAPFDVWRKDAELGQWEWYILLHMLHGVDVDVKAVNVASNLLTLSALSYKPNGVCFPSFINVSLKQGNALISPLRPENRQAFLGHYKQELLQLLLLRQRLRDPNLSRGQWKLFHDQAAQIGQTIVQVEIIRNYKKLFPGLDDDALLQRVREHVFCYEVEFPEVFFELVTPSSRARKQEEPSLLDPDEIPRSVRQELRLREHPGFDFLLGNPPWEVPALQLKKFLPDFDPEYLELTGKAAKEREEALLEDPVIQERWQTFIRSVEDQKKLLDAGWYKHLARKVLGKIPPGAANLYKYATELSWTLLKPGGLAGLVTDGGLWSDLASSGLRVLLLEQSQTFAVAGFTNTERLFPDIDGRMKFALNVFERGGKTEELKAVFMLRELKALERFDELAMTLPVEAIRNDPRDSYPIPEVREVEQQEAEQALSRHPMLQDDPWLVDTLGEEFHAGRQREFFHTSKKKGYLPLLQGTQFNLFGVHQGALPEAWLDPGPRGAGGFLRPKQEGRIFKAIADWLDAQGKLKGGKEAAARAWLKALTGSEELPDEWVRLDWDGYRLAWRDIARNDDKRTLICAILPAKVGVSHKAPFVRPFAMSVSPKGIAWSLQYEPTKLLFLSGMLSSFSADSIIRTRIAKTNFSSQQFKALPVPVWKETKEQVRIAELTARLTCLPATEERPWADYTELAAAVGLTPERDGLVEDAPRREAIVELNALAAQQYGLGKESFAYLMNTLFMTPAHKAEHEAMRDAISARWRTSPPRPPSP